VNISTRRRRTTTKQRSFGLPFSFPSSLFFSLSILTCKLETIWQGGWINGSEWGCTVFPLLPFLSPVGKCTVSRELSLPPFPFFPLFPLTCSASRNLRHDRSLQFCIATDATQIFPPSFFSFSGHRQSSDCSGTSA